MTNSSFTNSGGSSTATVLLSSFYFYYFAFLGCLLPFWPVYLKELGFTGFEVGLAHAVFLGTKILAPSVAGVISDRTGFRIRLIRVGIVGAGVGFSLFLLGFDLLELILVTTLYSVFWNAILSQFEAYTLESLGEKAVKYSRIRMWGSIGFIVLALGLGSLFEVISLSWLPWIMLGVILLAALTSFYLPEISLNETTSNHVSILPLLRKSEILCFLAVCLLMQISHGPYYSFYSLYMKEHGYSHSLVGGFWAIGVVSEVLLFLVFPSWVKRVGVYALLQVSIILSVVRWLLIGLYPEHGSLVVIAQTLHAFSFGCLHVVSMVYVQQFFAREFSGRGQALYSGVSFGLGGAIGALLSGYLWGVTSHSSLFFIAAAFSCFSVLFARGLRNA